MEASNGEHTIDTIMMCLPHSVGEPSLVSGTFEAQKLKAEPQHYDGLECSQQMPSISIAINPSNGLPAGVITMGTPAGIAEQLMVAVQNANGVTSVDPNNAMKGESSANALLAAKLGSNGIGINGSTAMINTPFGPSPLAGVVGLTGHPQVPSFGISGLAGINMVNQLASAIPGLQATTTLANSGVSTGLTNATPVALSVAANGQPNLQQMIPQAIAQQVAATPQFILAAGQPIQGIQGAQLLIPTSSGVAIQQLITIPASQFAGNQIVQMVASNGQIFNTTLSNLQSLSQTFHIPGISSTNTAVTSSIQPQSVVAAANIASPVSAMPQLLTNASGQVLAMGPQVFTQPILSANQLPANVIQMAPQVAAQLQQQQLVQQQLTVQEEKQTSPPVTNQPIALVSKSHPSAVAITTNTQALGVQQPTSQLSLKQVAMVTAQLGGQSKPSSVQTATQHLPPTQETTLSHATQQNITGEISSSTDVSPTIATIQASNTISNQTSNIVDGINLEEIKDFAKAFKIRRLSLGLTQTQVGQALSATEGPSYSQSAICRFEKLDITPKSAQKIKPVLERWMKEAEERYKNGGNNLTEFIGSEPSKKRKRRTSFTPAAIELLNKFFEKNTHPSGAEMTELAEQLNYEREVVRVWFCNKRQALKNTIKKLKSGT
ncbi:POU domain, class 6, transcription factor 1-like isoform X2 [Limulus polyphemus]|uniref:POU domain protein n=1 Tax=Limulus polyphemus TaxID=6850 RepID=A0ABM1ST72_LIMPO|nr:POU domain, class 6, transcription factor 1-like isoform X2 [Limulus polyphemus]